MSHQSDIRIGIIGVGTLGEIHVRLACELDGTTVAGVYDVDDARVQEISRKYDVPASVSVDALIDDVDACVVVTPTVTHCETTKRVLEAGRHAFVEKPLAATAEESRELTALAHQNARVLQVGHVERFNPAFTWLMDQNIEPLFIDAERLARFSPRATDVAVVLDLMVHDIDIILALNGGEKPTEIRASGVSIFSDELDIANARLEFANGCTANLTASRISRNPLRKMRVFATDRYASIDFAGQSVETIRLTDPDDVDGVGDGLMLGEIERASKVRGVQYESPKLEQVNAIANELAEFVDAIANGAPTTVTGEIATEAIEVAGDVIEAIEQKTVS